MRHEKRRFVEQVDYLTSPGWVDGPGGRERAGLRQGRRSAFSTKRSTRRACSSHTPDPSLWCGTLVDLPPATKDVPFKRSLV